MRKFVVFILITLLVFAPLLSSCALIKKMVFGKEDEDMKPAGFIETRENDLFVYDVFKDYIALTEYIGTETDVIIPDRIDDKPVEVIGTLLFFDNNIVTSVILPETITTIEASAFYYCDKLIELVIPDSVISIGERAFAWCSALETVILPSGLTEISEYTFNQCKALKEISIPITITDIGVRAFSWCISLERVIVPSSVVSIGENAFLNCSSLEYAVISESTVQIGVGIFADCGLLTVVTPTDSPCYLYCLDNDLPTIEFLPEEESEPDESSD